MKQLLIFILFLNVLLAEENNEAQNIINSASEGREVILKNENNQHFENNKKEKLYVDEVILNWHYSFQKENKRFNEIVGKYAENTLVKNVKNDENKTGDKNSKNEKLATVKGYCFIKDEINVGKQPSSLRTECQTNYGAITIFGNLVNVDDKASLVLDAKYIEKDGYRFQVVNSIVTNEDKTSYNIATYVNDRKIAEVALESVSKGSTEVKTYTNQYLKALEQSKQRQEMVYNTTTNGSNAYITPSTLTNTQPPDPLSYLAIAGTNIVTSAVKGIADIF